jgi:hypothetical protein
VCAENTTHLKITCWKKEDDIGNYKCIVYFICVCAGKTTLLNVLGGRLSGNCVKGEVRSSMCSVALLNGLHVLFALFCLLPTKRIVRARKLMVL